MSFLKELTNKKYLASISDLIDVKGKETYELTIEQSRMFDSHVLHRQDGYVYLNICALIRYHQLDSPTRAFRSKFVNLLTTEDYISIKDKLDQLKFVMNKQNMTESDRALISSLQNAICLEVHAVVKKTFDELVTNELSTLISVD